MPPFSPSHSFEVIFLRIKLTGWYQLPNENQPQPFDFEDVFDASFMHKYTRYRSLEKFLTGSRLPIASQKDFEELPEEKMDAFVKKASKFSSWQEMLDFATDKYARRKR